MKRQQYISQIKEAKPPEKHPKETELSNLQPQDPHQTSVEQSS